jgi:hypothetical protein
MRTREVSPELKSINLAMYVKRAEQSNPEVPNSPGSPHLRTYTTQPNSLLKPASLLRCDGKIEMGHHAESKLAQACYGLAWSNTAIEDRKLAEKQQETDES